MMPLVNAGRLREGELHTFSWLRASVIALVVFVHTSFVLLLLVPAAPWKRERPPAGRLRADGRAMVLVFLKGRHSGKRQPSRTTQAKSTSRATHHEHARALAHTAKVKSAHYKVRHAAEKTATASAPGAFSNMLSSYLSGRAAMPARSEPDYIPGGRAFQRDMHARIRREQHEIIPDNHVAGAPRFAMKDPKSEGVAGLIRFIGSLTGAVDPVCSKAGWYSAMSDKELASRYVSRSDVRKMATSHDCVMKHPGWRSP